MAASQLSTVRRPQGHERLHAAQKSPADLLVLDRANLKHIALNADEVMPAGRDSDITGPGT
jgi:hypothetical protein